MTNAPRKKRRTSAGLQRPIAYTTYGIGHTTYGMTTTDKLRQVGQLLVATTPTLGRRRSRDSAASEAIGSHAR